MFSRQSLLTGLKQIKFAENDPENPRAWSKKKKLVNVAVIASMASKHSVTIHDFPDLGLERRLSADDS